MTDTNLILTKPCHITNPRDFNNQQTSRLTLVNAVKNEAEICNFKSQSDTCNVSKTLIRDQVLIGVSEEDFRKNSLKEEWTLQQLEDHGRRTEAAALTDNSCVKISKIAGKYSKKYLNE